MRRENSEESCSRWSWLVKACYRLLVFILFNRLLGQDIVDDTKFFGFFGVQIKIAVAGLTNFVDILAGVVGEDLIECGTGSHNFVSLNLDIGDLSTDATVGLMDHDLGMLK